jgi:hypothetical protein
MGGGTEWYKLSMEEIDTAFNYNSAVAGKTNTPKKKTDGIYKHTVTSTKKTYNNLSHVHIDRLIHIDTILPCTVGELINKNIPIVRSPRTKYKGVTYTITDLRYDIKQGYLKVDLLKT